MTDHRQEGMSVKAGQECMLTRGQAVIAGMVGEEPA